MQIEKDIDFVSGRNKSKLAVLELEIPTGKYEVISLRKR